MDKKIMSAMLGVMLLFSMSMVMAQEPINDVVITAGETGTADFTASETQSHSSIGGLISEIIETVHHVVKMGGVTILEESDTNQISDFELYLFGDISQINFDNLESGNVYQASEEVEVRGVTGVWTTYNVNSTTTDVDPAKDKAAALNEEFTADDGTFVKAISQDLAGGSHSITFSTGQITTTQFEGSTLCGGLTSGEAKTKSGSTSPQDTFCGTFGTVKVIGVTGTSVGIPVRFIYDLDNDGDFDDMVEIVTTNTESGYKVDSISGQTLALVPANTYDVFAIM